MVVRAIQAGVGWWGIRYVTTFAPRVPGVEMVGYIARSDKSKRALADAGVPQSQVFPTLAEAARETGAELLINATRTDAHHAVIGEALDLGLHVLTDKPFAATTAEAKDLVARAAAKGRLIAVAENYRYDPAPMKVHALIGRSRFGALLRVAVNFRMNVATWDYPYPYPDIQHPILADLAIHQFHMLRWLMGDEPRRVSALAWNRPGTVFKGSPAAVATIEFERGTIATFDGSYLSTGPATAWQGEWSMEFEGGEIWWTGRDGADRVVLRPVRGAPEEVALEIPQYPDAAGALQALVQTIETGSPPPEFISGADNLKSLALTEAAQLSAARRGDWVDVAEVLN